MMRDIKLTREGAVSTVGFLNEMLKSFTDVTEITPIDVFYIPQTDESPARLRIELLAHRKDA